MTHNSNQWIRDEDGRYSSREPVTDEDILALAGAILKDYLKTGDIFTSPRRVQQFLQCELGHLEREAFGCMFLTTRHALLTFEILFYGTVDSATVHPREVVKRALELNATAVILAHNHPSGNSNPSKPDEHLTKRLKDALALIEVRVLDHIIVTPVETTSMAERGMV